MLRSILVGVWVVLGFVVSAEAQVVTAEQRQSAFEVLATVAVWADAVRDRDTKKLEHIFADDMVITAFDGSVRGKKEELEVLKPNPNLRTTSVTNEHVGLKIFGEVAVVTAQTTMEFVVAEKTSRMAMRYTAVFVKRDGRWQIVVLQTARLQPAVPGIPG